MEGREEHKLCPLGIEGRTCQYQETYAKDISGAIKGELTFLCRSSQADCPYLEGFLEKIKRR